MPFNKHEAEMKLPDSFVAVWAPRALSILRIVAAFLFMAHGMQKLLGFPVPPPGETSLMSLSGVAGIMELIGGALLLVGLFTRPVAFLVSGEMAFAYFIAHAPQGFWPIVNRGEARGTVQLRVPLSAAAGGGRGASIAGGNCARPRGTPLASPPEISAERTSRPL